MTSPCTGECCSDFILSQAPNSDTPDDKLIRAMVIPNGKGKGHFTCRFWDEETRLCLIYQSRPQMCRDFPDAYSGPCSFCGWTQDEEEVKLGKAKEHQEDVAAT